MLDSEQLEVTYTEVITKEFESMSGEAERHTLFTEVRNTLVVVTLDKLILRLGTTAFQTLSFSEQFCLDFFVKGGCCIHKEMYSSRGRLEVDYSSQVLACLTSKQCTKEDLGPQWNFYSSSKTGQTRH